MTVKVVTILTIGIAIIIGFITGNGVVYGFNHIPDAWLGVNEKGREWQRIGSVPWKWVFSATFIVFAIYAGIISPVKAPGVYAAAVSFVMIAISAKIYRRVPRQFVWMLLICGIGILPLENGFLKGIVSHLIGLGIMFVLGGVFYFAVRKKPAAEKLGMSDTALWELLAATGFILGGVQGVYVLAASLALWLVLSFSKGAGQEIEAEYRRGQESNRAVTHREGKSRGDREADAGQVVMHRERAPLAFFFAAISAVWIIANINHTIL